MGSIRFSIALCVVLIGGTVAAVPGAAAAQEDQTTLTVTVVDQEGDTLSNVAISATWADGDGGPVNETTRSNGQALIDVAEGSDVTLRIDDEEYVRNAPYVVEDASGQSIEVTVSRAAEATVTVSDDDGPVENARVRLQRSGQFVTTQRTGSDGTVTTPQIEEGEYRVIVTKDGYYRNTTRAEISGETDVGMNVEQGSVLLRVTVIDDHFEEPRPVRDVSVNIPTVGTLQSQSDGQVTTSVAVNTEYDLTLEKEGYDTVDQSVSVRESDREVRIPIQREPEVNLASSNQRVVVGETVRLEATDEYGEPVGNATISIDDEEVGTTDAEGVANVEVPTEGNVTYTVTSEDGLLATATVEGVSSGDIEGTAAGTETDDEEFDLPIGEDGPGFTPVTALIAVALLTVFALRRR